VREFEHVNSHRIPLPTGIPGLTRTGPNAESAPCWRACQGRGPRFFAAGEVRGGFFLPLLPQFGMGWRCLQRLRAARPTKNACRPRPRKILPYLHVARPRGLDAPFRRKHALVFPGNSATAQRPLLRPDAEPTRKQTRPVSSGRRVLITAPLLARMPPPPGPRLLEH